MLKRKLSYIKPGQARYTGMADQYVCFTMDHQLMNANTWKDFVRVFRDNSDDFDQGWRGEYWGKMMRGACLTYMYNGDEDLYRVLEETVRDMLNAQRPDGRFSTYSQEAQLNGWDVWSRKYVLTAMLHFYCICREETLKERILSAMCRHMDALIAKVGEGKIPITQTSEWWGGINSCSILDAVIELHRISGKEEYLKFAKYIISTGGCEQDDLIELALKGEKMPWQYPVIKAYETISFFEGVLSYYEVTGEEKYLTAVQRFVEAVNDTDITIIGCAGCTNELFDNSTLRQVLFNEHTMQETCVTVTWMRMMARLHLLTGEAKYFARMEKSAYNALYGSVNSNQLKQLSFEENAYVEPLPFESYSPLYNNSRGRGVGGFKRFSFGGYYGCCACIAAAGIAIFPLCAALQGPEGPVFNSLMAGKMMLNTPGGQTMELQLETTYPADVQWEAVVTLANSEEFEWKLRVPEFFTNLVVTVNDIPEGNFIDGYWCIRRCWSDGDVVKLKAQLELIPHAIGGKTAFTYGVLTLARDANKEGGADLEEKVSFAKPLNFRLLTPQGEEQLRMELFLVNGGTLLLTDYASCGKQWLSNHNRITVWLNAE